MPICAEHSGVCVNIENIQKQTDNNSQDIKTLSDAVIKLTLLVENINNPVSVSAKHIFWDIDTKKFALKLIFMFSVILICCLVGINIFDKLDMTQFTK